MLVPQRAEAGLEPGPHRLSRRQQMGAVPLPGGFVRTPIFMAGRIEQQIGQDRADIEADRHKRRTPDQLLWSSPA